MTITTTNTTMQAIFGMGGDEPIVVFNGRNRVPKIDPNYVWQPKILKVVSSWYKLGRIADCANLALFGPFGSGKSEAIRQFAAKVGVPVYEDAGSPERTYADFVGLFLPNEKGGVSFQDSLLVKSMRDPGSIYLINEMDKLNPSTLADLHNLLDTDSIENPFNGEKVSAAPGWRFAATANTNGQGDATGAYHGTNQLNRATCSRFMWLAVDYISEESELKIVASKAPEIDRDLLQRMVRFARRTREIYAARGANNLMSTRQLSAWATRLQYLKTSKTLGGLKGVLELSFLNACSEQDVATFEQALMDCFGDVTKPGE